MVVKRRENAEGSLPFGRIFGRCGARLSGILRYYIDIMYLASKSPSPVADVLAGMPSAICSEMSRSRFRSSLARLPGAALKLSGNAMRMFYYFPRIRLTRKDWVVFSVDFAFDLDEVVCRI